MKHIFATLLAAALLISMLGGCAQNMSGETRTTAAPGATATARPTAGAAPSATPTDSTADGIIDAGRDAVDGVVGAGEDAVDDIVDAGEDIIDEVTGANSTARPSAAPSPKADR